MPKARITIVRHCEHRLSEPSRFVTYGRRQTVTDPPSAIAGHRFPAPIRTSPRDGAPGGQTEGCTWP